MLNKNLIIHKSTQHRQVYLDLVLKSKPGLALFQGQGLVQKIAPTNQPLMTQQKRFGQGSLSQTEPHY